MNTFRIGDSEHELRRYLLHRGYLKPGEPAAITPLAGGVSNEVVKVTSPGRGAVFKQALAKLRVEEDWFIDPERSNAEKECLKLMRRILGREYAPEVVFEDEENFIFAMELAPEGSEEWKKKLLRGEVDLAMAGQVARALAKLHNETFENADLTRRFDQPQRFLDCRVNPYFESIARQHPSLACAIRSEINRLLSVRKVLVHGDYSPKNILISPDGAQVWLLDAEAAHLGDPSFDIAFLLSHLLLKAVKVHRATERMLEAFLHIGSTYGQAVDVFSTSWIEKHTCREMGLLLLARVDGKSPVEYLATDSEKNIVRCAAIRVIQERSERYTTVAGIIAEEIQRARHAV